MEYSFNFTNLYAQEGIGQTLNKLLNGENVVIVCIGSDLVLGDSLGPLVGTMLKNNEITPYIYGTLNFPITAKEVEYARTYIKQMHPNCKIIAVDAAVGNVSDIGLIKISDKGLYPGKGVDKNLGEIGDISIIGIVTEKSADNYKLLNMTRLNIVYKMAEKITGGIINYIKTKNGNERCVI